MKELSSLGRFFYAIPLIFFGIFHFMNPEQMAGLLKGWPMATFLVYFSGSALILAAISIIINVKARLACVLLTILLLFIIGGIDIPNMVSVEAWDEKMRATVNLLKDIGLMGAALTYAGILRK
jgi:putative oxidoreductase